MLGYQHRDLTAHPYQVHEWYGTEDGLNLRALAADAAALTAAAQSAEQALRLQEHQIRVLADAWLGSAARASRQFLFRQEATAEQAVAALRAAAATLAELDENLRKAVADKVTATVQIEGGRAGERVEWLAAARAVSTGVGDRSAASELIDQEVKPFVDNDIGGQWLAAMRAATAAVADAYDAAVTTLRAGPVLVFDRPGDLGLSGSPVHGEVTAAPAHHSRTAPAGFDPGPDGASAWPAAASAGAGLAGPPSPAGAPPAGSVPQSLAPVMPPPMSQPTAPASLDPVPPAGLGQTLGGGPPTMPDMGSGLPGPGKGLADLFSGLIGSAAGALPEVLADPDLPIDEPSDPVDDSGDDEEVGRPEDSDADKPGDDEEPTGEEELGGEESNDKESGEDESSDPADSAEVPEPQPVPPEPVPVWRPPPVDAPPAEPLAAPAGATPCEIAADELPQVGA